MHFFSVSCHKLIKTKNEFLKNEYLTSTKQRGLYQDFKIADYVVMK